MEASGGRSTGGQAAKQFIVSAFSVVVTGWPGGTVPFSGATLNF